MQLLAQFEPWDGARYRSAPAIQAVETRPFMPFTRLAFGNTPQRPSPILLGGSIVWLALNRVIKWIEHMKAGLGST